MRIYIRFLFLPAFLLFLFIQTPWGQTAPSARIEGRITDPAEAVVPGASVTARNTDTGLRKTSVSNDVGYYAVPLLPPGAYEMTIQMPGFRPIHRRGIVLESAQVARIDFVLEVGEPADEITVTAGAPLVDKSTSMLGTLIDSRRVVDIPINGRNVVGLAVLLPGTAQVEAPQTFARDRFGPVVSVSGSRQTQNLFTLDGAHFAQVYRNTGQNYPAPDALQEVKVLTNTFSAEYGRNAGSVFSVVTKSGTNEFHGSLWEFHRNDALNARDFFAARKPQLIQNQFGFTAGGPILRDKFFAFGSYEGLRVAPEALSTSAFPLTEAERQGDFSEAGKPVRDPLTGKPFLNNQIPGTRIDPVAAQVISRNLMPLPNAPGGQYVANFATPQQNDLFLIRADLHLRGHSIDTRYYANLPEETDLNGQIPEYMPVTRNDKTQNITIGDTFALGPSLVNQARFSFNRSRPVVKVLNRTTFAQLGGNLPTFGVDAPPAMNISGRVSLGSAVTDSLIVNESLQFTDIVNWTRGTHAVKAGFDLLKHRYFIASFFRTSGAFTFNGSFSGNSAADFLLGKPSQLVVANAPIEWDGRQTIFSWFVQDDWHIRPRLTLNLGLRYDLEIPWLDVQNRAGTLVVGQQSQRFPTAPLGLVWPGDPGVSPRLIHTDQNNFAPRVGFAWDLFGDGHTALRGGYGIFYDSVNADALCCPGQPFRVIFTVPAPFSLADPLQHQPPLLPLDPSNPQFAGIPQIGFPDPDFRSPYVQHFNLNLQREVVKDLLIQVGYVAKLGRKLILSMASNPAIYGPGATLGNINQRRILRGFGDNETVYTRSNSSYQALQVEARKRFSHGFSLQSAYAFARAIDDRPGSPVARGGTGAVPNVFDLRAERGLSGFHAKHIFSLSWIWDLPRLTSSARLLRAVAGGWEITGLVSAQSGHPINIQTGRDIALSGTGSQRPNLIGDPRLPGDRPRGEKILAWFNRAAFANPAAGTYGNFGRNVLIGPSAATANVGLFKNFFLPGREGLTLQFRSEFFNLFNSVNLGNPNTNLTAGNNMGRITSAGEARVIQFALKVLF